MKENSGCTVFSISLDKKDHNLMHDVQIFDSLKGFIDSKNAEEMIGAYAPVPFTGDVFS